MLGLRPKDDHLDPPPPHQNGAKVFAEAKKMKIFFFKTFAFFGRQKSLSTLFLKIFILVIFIRCCDVIETRRKGPEPR